MKIFMKMTGMNRSSSLRGFGVLGNAEMMMLKRLNYLRNALENYNSKETTAHLRDHAEKKKEERLMELWRTELEKPSVE